MARSVSVCTGVRRLPGRRNVAGRVIHHLQVIGEAAHSFANPLPEKYPEVHWIQIIALRIILVHGYIGLNLLQVWERSKQDLPG